MEFTPQTSLLHLLHRASQVATDRVFPALRDDELTVRQIVVLSAVAAHEGCSQTDIVTATGVDRSTVTDVVRRLVERGYIARRRAKGDARAYTVKLTAQGQKALTTALPVLAMVEARLLEKLSPKARVELPKLLSELVERATKDQ